MVFTTLKDSLGLRHGFRVEIGSLGVSLDRYGKEVGTAFCPHKDRSPMLTMLTMLWCSFFLELELSI